VSTHVLADAAVLWTQPHSL